jgi:hypothetical protein
LSIAVWRAGLSGGGHIIALAIQRFAVIGQFGCDVFAEQIESANGHDGYQP